MYHVTAQPNAAKWFVHKHGADKAKCLCWSESDARDVADALNLVEGGTFGKARGALDDLSRAVIAAHSG